MRNQIVGEGTNLTLSGSREFHASSAFLTFSRALSSVNGGTGANTRSSEALELIERRIRWLRRKLGALRRSMRKIIISSKSLQNSTRRWKY
ncbi:hypothetical protein DUNSADRAFT_11467 [Dunaliella salina]|uniref:Encoded protein n=1 Tax=Dunaliella salina TaxID=3046 RepID=A0ABQ7GDA3_DUNSA|nr:hypothetical protein DUNSADRAFT_11467 [Dunaliella salina]|eukprot:KAF5832595.1 hypothetical protein DUNSADRAFT_11467 [Dunaliella salina]